METKFDPSQGDLSPVKGNVLFRLGSYLVIAGIAVALVLRPISIEVALILISPGAIMAGVGILRRESIEHPFLRIASGVFSGLGLFAIAAAILFSGCNVSN